MKELIFDNAKIILQWTQNQLTKKQFLLFSSVMVGILAATAAIILKIFVHYIYVFSSVDKEGGLAYMHLFLPGIGILLTVIAVNKLLNRKLEKGLSHILYAIAKKSSFIPKEQTYAQIVTSSLTVGFGGSAGLEAPIVITGAALGSNYSVFNRLNYKDRTLLLACGVAAGIGAAFNAPIAGVLFSLEVLLLDISIPAFTPLIIAAATGALFSKIVLNDDILLSFQLQQNFNYLNVPFYIILGILAGLVSVYHSRIFTKVESIFSKKKIIRNVFIGAFLLASLIFIFPSLFGEGYQGIKILSSQHPEYLFTNSLLFNYRNNDFLILLFVGLLIFIKPIATALTLGSGGNGGNFAPSLSVGAYLGFFFSKLINVLAITNLPIGNFTIVGMAGILSGLYHAPLTAIFLIAEITGGYTLMIPLMIVSSISFAISKYFEPYAMDARKLANIGAIFTSDKDKNILTTINVQNLIESDFQKVGPNDNLGHLVAIFSTSKRNIFPVVDENNKLMGVVLLDNIRNIIFKREMYENVYIKELMETPLATITSTESMDSIMKKFDETGAWNLPVLDDGKYLGFISKTGVLLNYRSKLKDTNIE